MEKPESVVGMNIEAAAKKLIEEWGENAASEAAMKANEMETAGDSESRASWLKVRARFEELQN